MPSPSKTILQTLIQLGLTQAFDAPTPDWPTFNGNMPATPFNAVGTYDSVNKMDGRSMRTGIYVEHPGVQVRVRSIKYEDGYQKISDIRDALDALYKVEVLFQKPAQNVVLASCSRTSSILYLGYTKNSDNRTFEFSINYNITTN